MTGRLEIERQADGAVVLWIDNPTHRNALTGAILDTMVDSFESLGADDACRAIVLRGRGGIFCAGRALDELLTLQSGPIEAVRANYLRVRRLNDAIELCSKPTVAVVEGMAMGFGSILTSWCDIAIAADSAVFGYPEVRRGFAPTTAVPPLAFGVSRKAAADMLLTGRGVPAAEALRMGLVSRVVVPTELDAALASYIADLLQCEPAAIAVTKEYLRQCDDAGGYRSVQQGWVDSVTIAVVSAAGREGIASFLEKRKPRWAQ